MLSSLVGTVRLQEDMAGPGQSALECLKILRPRMYVEKSVSAHFLLLNPICWGLPLGINLSLYLAMLIFVNVEAAGCDCQAVRGL